MPDAELYTIWYWSLAVAGIVVLLAAVLLIAILLVARRILAHARQALEAAEAIAEETQAIWELAETNALAEEILATAESIEERGGLVAGTLHGERAPSREARG
jgi:flagellar biosynthesis/type III secretory pathway M-ring protein FliF/YscJ